MEFGHKERQNGFLLPLYQRAETTGKLHYCNVSVKATRTIREAAEYRSIGIHKIDSLLKESVKRKEFEEFLSQRPII